MKLIKQTVYLENNSDLATHFCSGLGDIETYFRVTEKEGYFLSEQELRELLKATYKEGYNYDLSIEICGDGNEEYINNLLKEE